MLGSKILGTKCIRTSMCNVLANHDQNLESRFRLLKVCLCVKLELSDCRIYWTKSVRLDRSKIRLDRSNLMQIVFLQNFQPSPSSCDVQGFMFYFKCKRKNPYHVLDVVDMLCVRISCEIQRCLPSYTFRIIKIKIYVKNLVISSVAVSRA